MVFTNFRNLNIIADDFGLAECVNDGIAHALNNDLISGASLMANGEAFDHAVSLAKNLPNSRIGVHLVLVGEKSLLDKEEIPSLVNQKGLFYKNHKLFFPRYLLGLIRKVDIERELDAQIKKCLGSGIKPQFINSHQHLHLLPGIMNIVIRLAQKHRIPYLRIVNEPQDFGKKNFFRGVQLLFLRLLSWSAKRKLIKNGLDFNHSFVGFMNAGNVSVRDIERGILLSRKYPEQNIELNCHPGFENEDLRKKYKSWRYNWEKELNALKS